MPSSAMGAAAAAVKPGSNCSACVIAAGSDLNTIRAVLGHHTKEASPGTLFCTPGSDLEAQAIKDAEEIGDAFLPGDCFWDPLQILTGAPDRMKRNMQERELFNGRFAMLAFAVFVYEEARTGKPIVSIPGNEILFEPAYQVPFIQRWLDSQFASPEPVFYRYSEEDVVDVLTSVELFAAKIADVFVLHL